MKKLSVAILTLNEEKNIRDCLESVRWADEIVVVDEKSTDKTVAIAKGYTKKIYLVDHLAMFHKNKQTAIDHCTHDWILQIDADERLTLDLAREIKQVLSSGSKEFAGYKMPRKNHIFGKWFSHTGWYPDYQVKLFRRGLGHYPKETVHEQIDVKGRLGTLTGDLLHENYQTVGQFVDRLNRYTTNDAEFLQSRGETVVWSDAIKFPLDEFLKRFFLEEGYKDGMHGLILSLLQATNRLVVFAKIWEKQKFWPFPGADLRGAVIKTVGDARHDWYHWAAATEKNPVKRLAYKLRKKL